MIWADVLQDLRSLGLMFSFIESSLSSMTMALQTLQPLEICDPCTPRGARGSVKI